MYEQQNKAELDAVNYNAKVRRELETKVLTCPARRTSAKIKSEGKQRQDSSKIDYNNRLNVLNKEKELEEREGNDEAVFTVLDIFSILELLLL